MHIVARFQPITNAALTAAGTRLRQGGLGRFIPKATPVVVHVASNDRLIIPVNAPSEPMFTPPVVE